MDLGVEGNVRHRNAVDREARPAGLREVKEAADVVVLVVAGENALGFGGVELKRR